MKNIVFDLESDHLIEKATTIHCLVLTDMDTGETKRFNHQPNGQPVASGIRLLQQAETIMGHNNYTGGTYTTPIAALYELIAELNIDLTASIGDINQFAELILFWELVS